MLRAISTYLFNELLVLIDKLAESRDIFQLSRNYGELGVVVFEIEGDLIEVFICFNKFNCCF